MPGFRDKAGRFLQSEGGPSAVEYAVLLALILVACIGIVRILGTGMSVTFRNVNEALPSSD